MAMHSVIVLRPRKRGAARGFGHSLRDLWCEVVAFERTHARVAWGATVAGFVVGLALRALG